MAKRTSSIRIEAATLDRLDRLADALDRSRTWLVNEAIERYLQHEEWFVRSVEAGVAAADGGETVPHAEVMDRLHAKAEKASS